MDAFFSYLNNNSDNFSGPIYDNAEGQDAPDGNDTEYTGEQATADEYYQQQYAPEPIHDDEQYGYDDYPTTSTQTPSFDDVTGEAEGEGHQGKKKIVPDFQAMHQGFDPNEVDDDVTGDKIELVIPDSDNEC